jgi:hypothetical protein
MIIMALKVSSSILQHTVTNETYMVTIIWKRLLHLATSVGHTLLAMVTTVAVFSVRYMLMQKKQLCMKHGCHGCWVLSL